MGPATRVMCLRDGTKKMSKSEPSDMSRINMTDDADTIAKKIQRAKTDPHPLPTAEAELETRPEADNLVGIYAALADKSKAEVLAEFGGGQFSTFKKSLAELAVSRIGPVNAEMNRLLADPAEIDRILAEGARKAQAIAAPIVATRQGYRGFPALLKDGANAGKAAVMSADHVFANNPLCRLLGIRYPICQAGMYQVATALSPPPFPTPAASA